MACLKYYSSFVSFLAFPVGQYLLFQAKWRETKDSSGCVLTFGK